MAFALGVLCSGAAVAASGGSWGPDTGTVDFSTAHEEGAEEQFRQAVALITYGYTRQGIRRLKRLLRRHPDADWTATAHYHLGLAYYQRGQYKDAFRHLGEFVASRPGPDNVRTAQELQLECALNVGGRDLERTRSLFDELTAAAHDADFAAECRWRFAALAYERRRYHAAIDAYLEFIDNHPWHENAPEAWFYVAASQYGIALRIERGLQHYRDSETALEDFLSHFPDHQRAEEAQGMLEDIRRRWAERSRRTADFYLNVRNNPHAALDYLGDIQDDLPGTGPAGHARERMEEITKQWRTPAPGGYIPLPLEGIRRNEQAD